MNKLKVLFFKYYPFWLGLLVLVGLNGYTELRAHPSIPMLIIYIIGYFKLTKFEK